MNRLVNGNFETGSAIGWELYSCASACTAAVITSSRCFNSTGSCYNNDCVPSTNIQFLEQSFNTTVGVMYTVTFELLKGGSGLGSGTVLDVNIF